MLPVSISLIPASFLLQHLPNLCILGVWEHFNWILVVFLRRRSGRGRKISWRSVRWWKGQIDVDKLIGLVAILEGRGRGLGRRGMASGISGWDRTASGLEDERERTRWVEFILLPERGSTSRDKNKIPATSVPVWAKSDQGKLKVK